LFLPAHGLVGSPTSLGGAELSTLVALGCVH
jgi:hypothetical protein